MSYFDDLTREPYAFDFFAVMRRLERSLDRMGPDQPRVGDGATRAQESVRLGDRTAAFALGQNPFMSFPASTLSDVGLSAGGRLRILTRFLGFLGPQGALPLAVTEETFHFLLARDEAFARFLDLFGNRFQQLFFRAWADARPAAQHDRPAQDRFCAYVGSVVGLGSKPYHDRDAIPDLGKLAYAGLFAPQAKSPSRLRGAIMGLFDVRASIEPFVGSWLALEVEDRTAVGRRNSGLGQDTLIGSSVFSIQDKFRIVLLVADIDHYAAFLPEGARPSQAAGRLCAPLVDLVFFYLGDDLDWEVELAIPAAKAPPRNSGAQGSSAGRPGCRSATAGGRPCGAMPISAPPNGRAPPVTGGRPRPCRKERPVPPSDPSMRNAVGA